MIQSVWKNLTGLIPAEHLCVTLNTDIETKTHHQTPMTYWYIWVQSFHTLQNCGNKDGNIIQVLQNYISTSVATVVKSMTWRYPYVMEMTKVVKPFIRSGRPNTFGNIVYITDHGRNHHILWGGHGILHIVICDIWYALLLWTLVVA